MLNKNEIEKIKEEVREYNKTADTDSITANRVNMGYSNEHVDDKRIPNMSYKRLCAPFDKIEDERTRLQIKRDYALMSERINALKDKNESYKKDIYNTFPTSLTRISLEEIEKLQNENRFFYVNDGFHYIILPFAVEKIIDNKN